MDDYERRAAFAIAKSRADWLLENPGAEAHRADVVAVKPLAIFDEIDYADDPLRKWHAGMVQSRVEVLPPVKPTPPPTAVEDFDREARVALAQYRLQRLMDDRVAAKLAEHDQRVAAKLAKHDEIWCEAIGRALAHERQLGRAEVEKADLRLRGLLHGLTMTAMETAECGVDVADPRGQRRAAG